MWKINSEHDFDSFFFKAELKRKEGALTEAVKIYSSLLEFRLQAKGPDHEISFSNYDVIIIERLSDLSQLFGWQRLTSHLLSGLIGLYRKYGKLYFFLHTVIKAGHQQLSVGNYREALKLIETHLTDYIGAVREISFDDRQLGIWENNCSLPGLSKEQINFFFAHLYYLFGTFFTQSGRYADAITSFDRGIFYCRKHSEALANLRELLVIEKLRALVEKGQLNQAKTVTDEFTLKEDEYTVSSGALINYLEIRSKIHLLQGEFEEAIKLLEEIGTLALKYQLYQALVTTLTNLASTQILINQVAEAEENLLEARELAESYGLKHLIQRIELLNQLCRSRILHAAGPLNLSPSAPQRASSHATASSAGIDYPSHQSTSFLAWFEDRALAFQILLADRQLERAAIYLSNINEVFHETDSILIHCRLEVLSFLLCYYLDQRFAEEDLFRLRSYLTSQNLLPELWQFQRVLSWNPALSPEQRESILEENQHLLDRITNNLSVESRAAFLLNKWTTEEEFLAKETNELLLNKIGALATFFKRPWYLLRNSLKINQLLWFLDRYKDSRARSSILGQTQKEKNDNKYSLFKRLVSHPADTITISFLVLPDRLVIFYYSFLKIGFAMTSVGRAYLRNNIREIHQYVKSPTRSRGFVKREKKLSFSDFEEKLEEASKILQIEDLLLKLPSRIKKIRFIPDDILHGFPFSLLKLKQEYLVRRFALSIAYEHSRVGDSKKRMAYKRKKALLVGISEARGFTKIPGVERELSNLQTLFSEANCQTNVIKNNAGNKNNILDGVRQSDIFHIACHGFFEQEAPDRTGLVLGNGEILSLKDILGVEAFTSLNHVTLSSCFGADHFVLPGRRVISLPETLWRSGVRSILGCLWEIDDSFAISFMERFYQYAAIYSKAEALQKTQLDALAGQIKHRSGAPDILFYWSGFQLYG